jgi:2-methylcitrate dehydratase PrpD
MNPSGPLGDEEPALPWLAGLVADLDPERLAPDVVARYQGAILDLLAAYVQGRGSPTAAVFETLAERDGGVVLETGAVAAAAHALELDDVHIDVTGWHPSVAIVAPLLSVGRRDRIHGAEAFAGVVAGWELGGRIGAAMTPAHRRRGFHATGTVGAIASAASVGRAQGLDARRLAEAMGLATSMASGTFGVLGGAPEAKHLHAAHGAMAGVYAVQLVEGGLRGPAGALDHPEGFYAAFAGGDVDRARLGRPLGEPWEIDRQMVKPHACCGHTFGAIDAAVELRRTHQLDLDAIDRIEVSTYDAAAVLTDTAPTDPVAARLSIPWCVAQALVGDHADGLLGMDAFEPATLHDPRLRAVAAKVQVVGSAASDALFPARRLTRVEVPGVGHAEVHVPRGMPENPVGPDELRAKFHALVGAALSPGAAEQLEGLVTDMVATPRWADEVTEVIQAAS